MTDLLQPDNATDEGVRHSADPLVDKINDALPQTQCRKCGYDGCRPYAQAISAGESINRCPPGGPGTIARLAEITGQPVRVLDPDVGAHLPRQVAVIREDECIGCTKCIQACPVDAIVGAAKLMHTVIAADCSGCDLCVEPCPVDCIDMVDIEDSFTEAAPAQSRRWRQRYEARQLRLARLHDKLQQRRLLRLQDKLAALDRGETIQRQAEPSQDLPARVRQRTPEQLRADIEAAIARTRAKKAEADASAPSAVKTPSKGRSGS